MSGVSGSGVSGSGVSGSGVSGMERRLGFATRAVHEGNDIDKETRAVRRPLTMANSFRVPEDLSKLCASAVDVNIYTRNGGPNQKYLEQRLASLEGAEDCVFLASGVAALHALFFTLLGHGDHVVLSDTTYIAVYKLVHEIFPNKYGVEHTLVDSSDPENVRKAIRPNTRLIHLETPANPTTKITDLSACVRIARERGIPVSVDNTWASPYLQRPIELGVDYVVESATKYINGHGDALGGAIAGRKEDLDRIRLDAQVNVGGCPSPFNAWQIMRGSATLPYRMKAHCENALAAARFLEGRRGVGFVRYPGLESHPGHKVAAEQMRGGFGGMIAWGLKDAPIEKYVEVLNNFKVLTAAVSLGHDESLIFPIPPTDERQYIYGEPFTNGYFRFSVGIEDKEDIIWDLDQALTKAGF